MADKAQPAWLEQSRMMWEYLNDHAELNEYQQLIFKGSLLEAYRYSGASNGNYSKIRGLLLAYGVVRVHQVGNKHQPSIVEITGTLPPGQLLPPEHLTEQRSAATMVAAIESEVKSLQAWRESLTRGGLDVARVLQDFELRLTRLEREVQKIGSPKTQAK